jgi:hypothetical protein
MGRRSTGAISTVECLQINISTISPHLKNGSTFLQGVINWTTGANISFKLERAHGGYEFELTYEKTYEGEKRSIDYKIHLITIPSNLGKGDVWYFLCPFTFQKCRILYMGYGSDYFKSRFGYRNRIYYRSQLSSRLDKHNDKFWRLDEKLEKLYPAHPKTHYNGKQTKAKKRITRLEEKKYYHDEMRWKIFPRALIKSMESPGL